MPPRTDAERRVAAVFAEVLGLDEVGAFDDFFTLGGHSLLAVKAIARLGAIPVRELFDHPTVAEFAECLPDDAHAAPEAAPMTARPPGTPPPLSRAQERLWFLQRLDPDDASYNMVNVVRLRGPLDATAFAAALGDLVARHETLRTRYPEVDGVPTALVEQRPPRLDHLGLTGGETEARLRVAERTNAPFDLTAAPPIHVTLMRLADDDHVLCLVLHHIAGDGWSFNILREDLGALYAARRDGHAPALAPVPLQFGDVAFHAFGDDGDDSGSRDYWRAQLADPTVLELPTDSARPAVSAHRGAFHGFELPADVAQDLEQLASACRTTLFTVLLAVYQVFLVKHTGQSDILIGSVFAGRDRVEFERVVGYFTTTLVLRGDVSADPSFVDFVGETRDTVLAAMTHQRIPFEDLLADLRLTRDQSRTPVFQTMFILHSQNERDADNRLADLDLEFFDSGYGQAKVDLTLEAWQGDAGLTLVLGYDADLFDAATIGSGATASHFCAPKPCAIRAGSSRSCRCSRRRPAAARGRGVCRRHASARRHNRTRAALGGRLDRRLSRRGRRELRRRGPHVRRTGPPCRRARRAPAPPRRRARERRRGLPAPLARRDRDAARDLARRRRLPATGARPAGRPARLGAGRQPRGTRRTNSGVAATWPDGMPLVRTATWRSTRRIDCRARSPHPSGRLRHLHLRLDRPAEGRRRRAPRARRPDRVDAARVRAAPGDRIVQFASLRSTPSAEEIFTALSTGAASCCCRTAPLTPARGLRAPDGQDVTSWTCRPPTGTSSSTRSTRSPGRAGCGS